MIGYWHDRLQYCRLSVCLSVCLWRCALWLNDTSYGKCLNKWIGSVLRKRFYNFQSPTHTLSPQTPHSQNLGNFPYYLSLSWLFCLCCYERGIVLLSRWWLYYYIVLPFHGEWKFLINASDTRVTIGYFSNSWGSCIMHDTRVKCIELVYFIERTIHRVSKNSQNNCFRQNFVKFPTTLTIFGTKMAKMMKLCEVHS